MLVSRDMWIWDIWLAEDRGVHHLFYLRAPRSLEDPELRHTHARIGHATSTDLTTWQEHEPALGPGPAGQWDDIATWTGSVHRAGASWELYYTGIGSQGGRPIQRIGIATSDDLFTWRKSPRNPVSTLDPRWYEVYPASGWHNQAWRDPWVRDDGKGGRVMAITARGRDLSVPADERGVIALARSDDGLTWTAGAPLAAPRISGDLEVPQLLEVDGVWYLLFCTVRPSAALRSRGIDGCVIGYLRAVSPDGPFEWRDDQVLAAGDEGLFGPRIVRDPTGQLVMLAWQRLTPDGSFGGWVTDPIPLTAAGGSLRRL